MNPILRSSLRSKALKSTTLPICCQRSPVPQAWRFYSQSSYGGGEQKPEGKAEAKTSKPTRDMEHPGEFPALEAGCSSLLELRLSMIASARF